MAAAAALLGRLMLASPLAGIVAAALAGVALALAGLLAGRVLGLVGRRPAFSLLMQSREGGEAMEGAANPDAAAEGEGGEDEEEAGLPSFERFLA